MRECKTCSFFEHRKVEQKEGLKQKIKLVIENLIVEQNVLVFLFGSYSEFDKLCHLLVTELKVKHPTIKRIAFTCQSETCILERDREMWENSYSRYEKRDLKVLGLEEEFEHTTKYTAGRASYVERNQAMIDHSKYCVFYYDENYKPEFRKFSKKCTNYYQPKSGTALAFEYVNKKT